MSKDKDKGTWHLEPHICRTCGGRILRYAGSVITGGGNPLYRCAGCGQSGSDMSAALLCWCGAHNKGSPAEQGGWYHCVEMKPVRHDPVYREALWGCGVDPDTKRTEIGIVNTAHLHKLQREQEEKDRRAIEELTLTEPDQMYRVVEAARILIARIEADQDPNRAYHLLKLVVDKLPKKGEAEVAHE